MFSYLEAKDKLLQGDCSCADFFALNNYTLEYAYCCLLRGQLSAAVYELKKIEQDFRANWALKLIDIIRQKINEKPSYFQIRNFLEIDLNLLLLARRPDYIENIINSADYLITINQEAYKFIARVMYNNGFSDVALFFLTKAKNRFYKDPEMHYLFAGCYLKSGEKALALKSLNSCLNLIPDYLPAKKLKESLINS